MANVRPLLAGGWAVVVTAPPSLCPGAPVAAKRPRALQLPRRPWTRCFFSRRGGRNKVVPLSFSFFFGVAQLPPGKMAPLLGFCFAAAKVLLEGRGIQRRQPEQQQRPRPSRAPPRLEQGDGTGRDGPSITPPPRRVGEDRPAWAGGIGSDWRAERAPPRDPSQEAYTCSARGGGKRRRGVCVCVLLC